MILECPNCGKRYLVDPRAVGANGRTVRCAACKKEWFASAPKEDVDEVLSFAEEMDATAAQEREPQRAKERRTQGTPGVPALPGEAAVPASLKVATAALGVMFVVTAWLYFQPSLIRALPFTQGIYSAFGFYKTDDIVLAELAYNLEPVGTKDRHALSGYLVNTSDEAKKLPVLDISMLDEKGNLVKHRKLTEDAQMEPGEEKLFSRYIDTSPESVDRIVVEIGSPMDIKLRSNSTETVNQTEEMNNE